MSLNIKSDGLRRKALPFMQSLCMPCHLSLGTSSNNLMHGFPALQQNTLENFKPLTPKYHWAYRGRVLVTSSDQNGSKYANMIICLQFVCCDEFTFGNTLRHEDKEERI